MDHAVTLPDDLRLGTVELAVADLDRSIAFYQDVIGLQCEPTGDGAATMHAGGEALVVLHEDPVARRAGRHAGLFHVALLSPTRHELARAALRVTAASWPVDGASDHGVSEALYLADPDGNGLELYADRPREQWPAPTQPGTRVGMYTVALDVGGLLDLVAGEAPALRAGPGLTVGHIHLHVGSLEEARAFYADILGFDLMASLGSALFLGAGGYHHHLGVNVWRGEGVGPAPPHTVGLMVWTMVLPSAVDVTAVARRLTDAGAEVDATPGGVVVRDPWGVELRIVA